MKAKATNQRANQMQIGDESTVTIGDFDYVVEGLNLEQTCVLHNLVLMAQPQVTDRSYEKLAEYSDLTVEKVTEIVGQLIEQGWVPAKTLH